MQRSKRIVSSVMQRAVETLRPNDHLELADDIMRGSRIRHMPVLDGERLVGPVTQRDLLAASLTRALDFEPMQRRTFLSSVEVREVMSKELVTIGAGNPLAQAARLLIERQIGCLPVLNGEGRMIGIVTETDLLRAAYCEQEAREDEVMTENRTADWRERVSHEIDELRRLRDELKVRVHLGKADAKDAWERLEKLFHELDAHARRTAQRSEAPLHEMGDAARKLIDELRAGYRDLRRQL
jgi:CBS domain-containing protein